MIVLHIKDVTMRKSYHNRCTMSAPAEVDIATTWTEDSILKATSLITFPISRDDCPYGVKM